MKIDEKILKKYQDTFGTDRPQTSHFQDMLSEHLRQARSDANAQNSNSGGALSDTSESREYSDLVNNINKLSDIDSEYFEKANKKKTLAESFSSRFGASTEERIDKFKPMIEAKAEKYDLDPNLLAGLIRQESNFNPYAVSSCGAMGLGQLMPETARSLGVTDPFNAAQNLDGCAKYLKQMLDTFGGNTDKALAAYNAGPGAVHKYGGIPPYSETQNYVKAIHGHRQYMVKNAVFAANAEDVPDTDESV